MTYCIALKMDSGLLFLADTRTNAGVDNVSSVKKIRTWRAEDRIVTIMSAGNLATTQAVTARLEERHVEPDARDPSIFNAPSMFEIARLVGTTLRAEVLAHAQTGASSEAFSGTLIVGGQVGGSPQRLYLVYPEGNFIEATADNPFFQIGEAKYGKPIILRAFDPTMDWRDAVKLLLVSMDSTVRSNLSVGPPFDVRYVARDSFELTHERRIEGDDPYYSQLSRGWGESLKRAFEALPEYGG